MGEHKIDRNKTIRQLAAELTKHATDKGKLLEVAGSR